MKDFLDREIAVGDPVAHFGNSSGRVYGSYGRVVEVADDYVVVVATREKWQTPGTFERRFTSASRLVILLGD